VAVTAVVFDVGETLVDETRGRERVADSCGVPRFTLLALVGVREHLDFVGSSERWGVEKPAPELFDRVALEAGRSRTDIAYVGDRVDNDVLPAKRAGMVAVHIRRGPYGVLRDGAAADARIESLDELPAALP
jgi:FMN phosphatase YigB (HAD superfamily)